MKIIDLIEHISDSDEKGFLKLVPFGNIDYDRIKTVVVYTEESVNSNLHGNSTFDDDIWRYQKSSVNFSSLAGALKYEVKSAFLLANTMGIFEGGSGRKFSSIRQQIIPLIRFAEVLQEYGISSIMDFNLQPGLIKRNQFIALIKEKLNIEKSSSSYNFKFFEENFGYSLLTEES